MGAGRDEGGTRPLLILVTGTAPGVGKSETSRRIASLLRAGGAPVEHFDEADVLVRPEFADLIAVWARGERPGAELVLDAATRYLAQCARAPQRAFVQDALFPFLPSLFAWGYTDGDITAFLTELGRRCSSFDVRHIHLVGDPAATIPRAATREGSEWLAGFIARVGRFADGSGVVDAPSLATYFEANDDRARRLLAHVAWPVCVVDASVCRGDVASVLGRLLEA